MTHMTSVGAQELLLELFEEKIDLETFKTLANLSKEELYAINELLKESGA